MTNTETMTSTTIAVLLALGLAGLAHAQETAPRHLADLEANGVVFMDDINTPLLHHAATGTAYNPRVLARGDEHTKVPRPEGRLRDRLHEQDEFVRQEAMPLWQTFLDGRIAVLRQARAYLIPVNVRWMDYDFARARFPIALEMNKRASLNAGPTYHCAGAFDVGPQRSFKTACLHAVNEDQNDAFLRSFPVEDHVLARRLRQERDKYLMFAVAEPAGKYRVLRGNEIRYMPLEIYAAAGYQPVRITQLVLATPEGEVIAVARKNSTLPRAEPAARPVRSDGGAAAPASPTAPPGWTLVGQDATSALYADPDSVRREGAIVMLRTLTDLGEQAGIGMKSAVSLYESDCGRRTTRLLRHKGFAGRFGKGGVFAEALEPQPAMAIVVGSIGESLFNYACNASSAAR
ncbi:surface-adhesin E family protein [Massilia sp. LjRoot122]|uniref:surface-adhesin E family protein n=1 Tax=Massilia sp. LjRoot122 TaxID=3342257 RepID=UPI003ECEF5DD